jgi:hypothetical protein
MRDADARQTAHEDRQVQYDLLRSAILEVVPHNDEGIEFRRLAGLVRDVIAADELARLGSLSWYTTTVKLDLEVEGEIERIPDSRPERLRRST